MSAIGASKAKEKRDADATVPDKPLSGWEAATYCKVCGEPKQAKVTGLGAVSTKCMCAENAMMTSVHAMGVVRVQDGWEMVELLIPERLLPEVVQRRHPVQSGDVVAAKLEEWFNRRATGVK